MLKILSTNPGVDDALEESSLSFVPENLDQVRYLGSADGWDYYVATRDDGKVCLVARDVNTDAAGCARPEYFKHSGTGLNVARKGEPEFVAYLIPDGYAEAAQQLEWAELIGRNLLVATDVAAMELQTKVELAADEEAMHALELALLSGAPPSAPLTPRQAQ